MKIHLDRERTKLLTQKIQLYFEREFDETIGELKAGFILQFFINELGPAIYNQGLSDAQAFLQDKLIDLESTLALDEN